MMWNDEKGFGFIRPEHGPDLFVHHSDIEPERPGHKSLSVGQVVVYEPERVEGVVHATAVHPPGLGAAPRGARH